MKKQVSGVLFGFALSMSGFVAFAGEGDVVLGRIPLMITQVSAVTTDSIVPELGVPDGRPYIAELTVEAKLPLVRASGSKDVELRAKTSFVCELNGRYKGCSFHQLFIYTNKLYMEYGDGLFQSFEESVELGAFDEQGRLVLDPSYSFSAVLVQNSPPGEFSSGGPSPGEQDVVIVIQGLKRPE
jgi:hypothetical protein